MPSVLITGANRGLGLEFARQYAADDWQVYSGYRDLSSASKLRRSANTGENKIRIMALDVTDPTGIKAASAELDGQAIDVIINNAGVMGAQGQTSEISITRRGPMCLTSTPWVRCGFQRRLLTTWHEAAQAHRHPYQRHGIDYRQYFWRLNRLSQFKGCGEHSDAQSRNRSRTTRHHLRGGHPGWVLTDMGGPQATMTPAESVKKMRDLIETLGPAQSGQFFNHDGREYPW